MIRWILPRLNIVMGTSFLVSGFLVIHEGNLFLGIVLFIFTFLCFKSLFKSKRIWLLLGFPLLNSDESDNQNTNSDSDAYYDSSDSGSSYGDCGSGDSGGGDGGGGD